ncbi:hypothetical protein GN956_G4688 [Arapaima gigas]
MYQHSSSCSCLQKRWVSDLPSTGTEWTRLLAHSSGEDTKGAMDDEYPSEYASLLIFLAEDKWLNGENHLPVIS